MLILCTNFLWRCCIIFLLSSMFKINTLSFKTCYSFLLGTLTSMYANTSRFFNRLQLLLLRLQTENRESRGQVSTLVRHYFGVHCQCPKGVSWCLRECGCVCALLQDKNNTLLHYGVALVWPDLSSRTLACASTFRGVHPSFSVRPASCLLRGQRERWWFALALPAE